jgi:putative membrane protein
MKKTIPVKLLAVVSGLWLAVPLYAADAGETKNEGQKVLSDLHHTNQMEIQMGMMAKEKTQSDQVRTYADRLVKDHQDADNQVQELAKKNGYSLMSPDQSGMMEEHKAKKAQSNMADLSKKTGSEFDKAFAKEMVDDHKKDISKLEKAEKDLKQADVRDLVSKILPTLQQHLQMAEQIEKANS